MRTMLLTLCLLLIASAAFAQSDRGTITGTVSDPAGAVVAGAAVQARNVETGFVYDSAASSTGNYTLLQLPAGSYEMDVTVPGFKKYVRSGITVQVAQTLRIDVSLEVGSSVESVTVTAEASLLKTESGAQSSNVKTSDMNALPILGIGGAAAGTQGIRNPNAVALMIPGVFWTANANLQVNGVPANTQSYRIEGQEAMNTGTPGTTGQNQPSVDAIQELAIQTSNFSAEFGQVGGGVFNLTMKSGTNQYHGSVYDYFVNEVFNANAPYLDTARQRQRRQDYGYTFGGPVWIPKVYNGRDKTFFFLAWEQFRETLNVNNQQQTVPIAAFKTGNFASAITTRPVGSDPLGNPLREGMIFDPNTTTTHPGTGRVYRTQFPNNAIPIGRFDPVSVKIQALFPNPQGLNAGGPVQNYINAYKSSRISTIPSLKLDHNLSAKGKLTFFWQETKTENPNGNPTLGQSDGLPGYLTTSLGTFTRSPLYRLNYDHTLTPTMLLHFGAGYRETNFSVPAVTPEGQKVYDEAPFNADQQLGLKGLPLKSFLPRMSGLLNATTGGMKDFGGTAVGRPAITQSPTFNSYLTWVKSNHTYKFGSEFRLESYYAANPGNDGSYAFSPATTGQPYQNVAISGANVGFGYASFLLGDVNSVTMGGAVSPRTGKSQLGIYAQDTWKVTRKLTVDYGIRYDYSTYLQEQYGRAPAFSPVAIHPTSGRQGAAVYDGYGPKQCNCRIAQNYPFAIAPRLGIAYQITSKTVFRTGFGIVYNGTEQNNNATGGLAASTRTNPAPGFGFPVMKLADGVPLSFRPPVWPLYDPAFFPTAFPTPGGGPTNMDRGAGRPARQYQWSVGFQREIFPNLVVEASYVGNRGVWWQAPGLVNLNAIPFSRLQSVGLSLDSAADRTLLTSFVSSPTAQQRGFGGLPYAGFPASGFSVAQALRPYPHFTNIATAWNPGGKTWYDSLQVVVTKRFSQGLQFNTNFTWQKNLLMGAGREPNFGTDPSGQDNDVFNRQLNKYIAGFNQPLVLITSLTYVTPRIQGNKWMSAITRDWTVGALLRYSSGLPFAVPGAVGTPSLANLVFQDTFANRVPGEPLFATNWVDNDGKVHTEPIDLNCHCFDPRKEFVLNRAAWADPAPGTFGTSAAFYDDYRQQRRPQENLNIGRTFRFREGVTLNIRAEFTNVLNRAFIGNPASGNYAAIQNRQPSGNTASGFGSMQPGGGAPREGLVVGRFTF